MLKLKDVSDLQMIKEAKKSIKKMQEAIKFNEQEIARRQRAIACYEEDIKLFTKIYEEYENRVKTKERNVNG